MVEHGTNIVNFIHVIKDSFSNKSGNSVWECLYTTSINA